SRMIASQVCATWPCEVTRRAHGRGTLAPPNWGHEGDPVYAGRMLSPDSATSPVILAIVFGLLVVGLVINALVKDRRAYQRFALLTSSRERRRTLGRWLLQAFLLFGGCSLVTLVLAWRYVPLVLDAVDEIPWVADARAGFANSGFAAGLTIGIVIALVAGAVLGIVLARRSIDGDATIPTVGDVQALLPRNRAELPYGAAISINAGIVEELLFRLAMPALIFGFTHNAGLAVVASVIVFGALHAYQGVAGVIGATLIGAALMFVYLSTENIVVAIVAHALFDLRSLVLIPVIVTRAHRIPATD
ncbi:MAG TPA: CPBP family intramembrane glutamic endopeptidase, partial [Kofleriaceae bacterium]